LGNLWPAGVLIALGPAENAAAPGAGSAGEAGEAGEKAGSAGEGAPDRIYPRGTVFFPPEGLRLRAVRAEGEEAWLKGGESLVCRDLAGEDAAAFTAAAMLYRILAGAAGPGAGEGAGSAGEAAPGAGQSAGDTVPEAAGSAAPEALPFPARDADLLHQDMREGVFLPLRLAAPGLKPEAAALVDRALAGVKEALIIKRPPLAAFGELLKAGPLFRELRPEEREILEEERRRYEKKRKLAVGTRRFVVRNTAILGGIAAALVITILIVNSVIASRRDRPTTAGMNSRQVVETYYGAFGQLDHSLMEACVLKKAGKGDIDLVTRFFVTTKVRQAYEYTSTAVISAQDWFDRGAPPTATPIFGVTDLKITRTAGDEAGEEAAYRAKYVLWIPGPADEYEEGPAPIVAVPGPAPEQSAEQSTEQSAGPGTALATGAAAPVEFIPPLGYAYTDEITLIRHQGNWRIARLDRTTE
jgi:hypothetical protein